MFTSCFKPFCRGNLKRVLLLSTLFFVFVACNSQPPTLTAAGNHTLEVRVAASADDAEERLSGSVNRSSSDLELVYDKDGQQTVGLRFAKLPLPAGATVQSAHLQFQAEEVTSEAASLTIRTEATANAAPFLSRQKNISARALSQKAVSWSPPAWTARGRADADQRTPDLAALVQEAVNRPGWQSGNALAFILTGTGKRVAESFDGNARAAPLLRVVYSVTEAPTNRAPTVNAGPDQTTGLSAALTGEVADDGLPNGNLTSRWSQLSGPGTVTFGDSSSAGTTATFSTGGSYTLSLSASDGALAASDTLVVNVQAEGAQTLDPNGEVGFPARAAFYYPWYPETWSVNGARVFYQPTLGYYDSGAQQAVDAHIKALDYAKVDVAIASWWGPATHKEQERVPLLFARTQALGSPLKWAFYYEKEGNTDPSVADLKNDLAYIKANYADASAYARVGGKPVLFVYNANDLTCAVADRWARAAADAWYFVLKVFPNYKACATQPDAWHQYAPAGAADHQKGYAYSVAPGFWRADEPQPRLARDLSRFQGNVRDMVASGEPWQLVTTFNEWGEGTAVEAALEWGTTYLDALHNDGQAGAATPAPSASTSVTLVAAGDIACDPASSSFNGGQGDAWRCRQKAVSDLVLTIDPDAVVTLGDNQYEQATLAQFQKSYDPSWGRVKAKTYPSVGNHEYLTAGASGYFDYFGPRAGDPAKGYYSYDLGSWHIVALNSNCSKVGGCGAGSPQETWLKADLEANPTKCTLAYWHHPRFSSGEHGSNSFMSDIWQTLYDAGAEVVLSGHDHNFERFAPQTASGTVDAAKGVRQFVVGTGGKNHYGMAAAQPNSQVTNDSTYGVLQLTLNADSYDWRFVPEAGQTFTDSGTASCH